MSAAAHPRDVRGVRPACRRDRAARCHAKWSAARPPRAEPPVAVNQQRGSADRVPLRRRVRRRQRRSCSSAGRRVPETDAGRLQYTSSVVLFSERPINRPSSERRRHAQEGQRGRKGRSPRVFRCSPIRLSARNGTGARSPNRAENARQATAPVQYRHGPVAGVRWTGGR